MAKGPEARAALAMHELRQPLTAILSAATALQSDHALSDDDRRELLALVVANAQRLRSMLQEPAADAAPGEP